MCIILNLISYSDQLVTNSILIECTPTLGHVLHMHFVWLYETCSYISGFIMYKKTFDIRMPSLTLNLKYSFQISYIYLLSKNVLWVKLEKILKGSLDSIPSPSPSVKIQIMGGNFVKAKDFWMLSTNFWIQKVCWQCPAMFCLITSSKLSHQ